MRGKGREHGPSFSYFVLAVQFMLDPVSLQCISFHFILRLYSWVQWEWWWYYRTCLIVQRTPTDAQSSWDLGSLSLLPFLCMDWTGLEPGPDLAGLSLGSLQAAFQKIGCQGLVHVSVVSPAD